MRMCNIYLKVNAVQNMYISDTISERPKAENKIHLNKENTLKMMNIRYRGLIQHIVLKLNVCIFL